MENTNNIVLHPDTKIMQRHWGWFLGFGILLLIFGIIGLGMDIFLTIVSMYFLLHYL